MQDARLALELVEVRDVPVVVPNERLLVRVLRPVVEYPLRLLDRNEGVGITIPSGTTTRSAYPPTAIAKSGASGSNAKSAPRASASRRFSATGSAAMTGVAPPASGGTTQRSPLGQIPSSRRKGIIASKYPSASTIGAKCPSYTNAVRTDTP